MRKQEKKAEIQSFGQWLQKALHDKRLTVGEFYQRVKVSRAGVYHYLRDQRYPAQDVLARISAVLSIPLSEFPSPTKKGSGDGAAAGAE